MTDLDDDPDVAGRGICPACNGSGMGRTEHSVCSLCRGMGEYVEFFEERDDHPDYDHQPVRWDE